MRSGDLVEGAWELTAGESIDSRPGLVMEARGTGARWRAARASRLLLFALALLCVDASHSGLPLSGLRASFAWGGASRALAEAPVEAAKNNTKKAPASNAFAEKAAIYSEKVSIEKAAKNNTNEAPANKAFTEKAAERAAEKAPATKATARTGAKRPPAEKVTAKAPAKKAPAKKSTRKAPGKKGGRKKAAKKPLKELCKPLDMRPPPGPPAKFAALVLSFDASHIFAKNMIASYTRLWPEHPFHFYVPYNGETPPAALFADVRDRVELVRTNKSISETMLTLLAHCNCSGDMVYYAIDDKYPTSLSRAKLEAGIEWMKGRLGNETFGGFHFWTGTFGGYGIEKHTKITFRHESDCEKISVSKCKDRCDNFFVHHFQRAWMLEEMYRLGQVWERKGKVKRAKQYDDVLAKEKRLRWQGYDFFRLNDCAFKISESTSQGRISKNTQQYLQEQGVEIPNRFLPATRTPLEQGCGKK